VAARYRTQAEREPLLPEDFGDPEAVLPRVTALAKKGSGVVAIRDGHPSGFLLGSLGEWRGRMSAWVPDYGHALAPEADGETYRTMYAALSGRWLEQGCMAHLVTVPARDTVAEKAWFTLGFGLTVVDALRDLDPTSSPKADVEVRHAGREDIEAIMSLESPLREHLAAAPIFLPEPGPEGRRAREEWLADERNVLWLAFREGTAVGFMGLEPSGQAVLPISGEGTVAIDFACTIEEDRGEGIATALLDRSLHWARSAGYLRCSVDFESANIPGARFWYGRGFRPVCHSLARLFDPDLVGPDPRRHRAAT
jgi:GNAT superfamily N-acetyltransferase